MQNYYRKILPLILYWSVIARDFNGTQNSHFGMWSGSLVIILSGTVKALKY